MLTKSRPKKFWAATGSAPYYKTGGGGGGSDPFFANVVLLMGFEGANASTGAPGMNDESVSAHGTATAIGNAQISTASPLVSTSSLLLDGTGDRLSFPNSADWVLTGQFTIEFTAKFNALPSVSTLLTHGTENFYGWKINTDNGGTFRFRLDNNEDGTADYDVRSGAVFTTGVTYSLALDRDATNKIRLYVNGAMVASQTAASLASGSTSNLLLIGSGGTLDSNGTIDEIRITKGVARYASDSGYTVTTGPFPRSGVGPVVIAYKDSGTDESNASTITFTGKTLSATGYNVVAVGGSGLGVGTWATCTIDGVAATLLTQIAQGANHQMATFVAASSGASSGTIVLTSAGFAMNFVVMGVWGMTGTVHPTPADTKTDGNLTSSQSLAIPASGAAIGFNYGVNNHAGTWTGMSSDFALTTTASLDGNGAHTNTGGTTTVGFAVSGGTEAGNIYTAWGP